MAVLPITTFCEVTYDSDWYEDDRHLTPYRYSLLRKDTESSSDTVSLTLPSYTYYEYLRSLYDCRTTATGKILPGYAGSTGGHIIENPERARTWHAFGKDTASEFSRAAIRSEPTKIRPKYPFPSLHLIQGDDSGDEYEEYAVTDRSRQKLVWVDALNKWVPENQLHPRPYMTFIGNAPRIEKTGRPMHKETEGVDGAGHGGEEEEKGVCERFGIHMDKMSRVPQPEHKAPSKKTVNNEKREAIRKRAQELAEERKQRKAYSTPLYTSMAERRNKTTALSSKIPHTTPTSPVDQKVPSPIQKPPKEAWQTTKEERQKVSSPRRPPSSPLKQEIPSTLTKAVDGEKLENVDVPDATKDKMDKKVKFQEESKTDISEKPKTPKKKKKDLDELSKEELEAKLAQQRLKDSLEKQRQQQMLEQQRILRERGVQNEMERKEKERLEEEERLQTLKRIEKRPLSKKRNDHENYYENTMNAAGQKLKGKGKGKPQRPKISKTEKPSRKSTKPGKSKEKTEMTQTTPRTKPVLAGTGKPPVSIPALSPRQREPLSKKEVPLPITVPSESKLPVEEPEKEEVIERPKVVSAHRERRKSIVQHREVIKKERRDGRKCVKTEEPAEPEKLPEIEVSARKVESWIYDAVDFSEKKSETSEKQEPQIEALPSLTQDLNPELLEKKKEAKEKRRKAVLANLIATDNTIRKWRKPASRDTTYLDELRRLELAEERRKKQMEMYERLKSRKHSIFGYATEDGSPSFEDSNTCRNGRSTHFIVRAIGSEYELSYPFPLIEIKSKDKNSFEDNGFLAKYCIFTKGNIEVYRHAFDAVDETKSGWLEGEDVMIALRGVNNRLTEAEEEYLYRVLELTGFQITHGADFKMFAVLAALSHRISALDKWMKNLIGKMDFKQLEMKMFKCKTLWECNVDKETNCISIDQLCVELRAGGVSFEHEMECREKLSHLPALDLLDFLTYVPLFIMIHESVVLNPLDDTRVK